VVEFTGSRRTSELVAVAVLVSLNVASSAAGRYSLLETAT
jgi:muramidase (phage lysozyme)